MKRRVTSLPPISSEVFAEKVIAAQASSTAAATRAAYEKTCTACEKTYFSENAFYNHVGSQKHLKQVARVRKSRGGAVADDASSVVSSALDSQITATADTESESEEEADVAEVTTNLEETSLKDEAKDKPDDSEAKIEVPLKRCLFCNYDSETVLLNVHHMERIHNMFIPERNYLVDLEGLITSLFEKINVYQECVTCGKCKPSVFGLQTHMRDKSHCSIPFGTEEEQLEIGEFYDFRSTYSDDEDDDEESADEATDSKASGGVKLGARRTAKENVDDEDEEMEDPEGWETDSSTSDSADVPPRSSKDSRPHKQTHAAYYSDYELHLPTGRAVGHRSLAKYYRQNLHNHPSPAERQEQFMIEAERGSDEEVEVDERVARRNDRERGRALNTRANGGRGMAGVSESKKKEVSVLETRARKQEYKDRQKVAWFNNKQNNSQKHFRVCLSVLYLFDQLLTHF